MKVDRFTGLCFIASSIRTDCTNVIASKGSPAFAVESTALLSALGCSIFLVISLGLLSFVPLEGLEMIKK